MLLHDHLDGGLRPQTVIELADEIGWTLPSTDIDTLQRWFTAGAETGDLLQYLATFEHTLAVMQQAESIERVAYEATVDLAADGVVYAEVRFAPELHVDAGARRSTTSSTPSRAGSAAARRDAVPPVSRSRSTPSAARCAPSTVRWRSPSSSTACGATDDKVVAFDLAGAETGFPPSLHAEACAFARDVHLNMTIHASEPPDLPLISDAIAQGAHRVGHGVRLAADTTTGDDGALVLGPLAQYVLDHQIHLEMAPTCNVQIGAVASVADHPIGPFLRAGMSVGFNTDNRLMSNVMPSSELLALSTEQQLDCGGDGAPRHERGDGVVRPLRRSPAARQRRDRAPVSPHSGSDAVQRVSSAVACTSMPPRGRCVSVTVTRVG